MLSVGCIPQNILGLRLDFNQFLFKSNMFSSNLTDQDGTKESAVNVYLPLRICKILEQLFSIYQHVAKYVEILFD